MSIEDYRTAGHVAHQALAYGVSLIRPGASMRTVLDKVEAFIREHGCEPAFPAQSCINEVAAHYCPTEEDDITYAETDLVKLDVGVHVNGFIGDNATTISLDGSQEELILAVKDAVDVAEALLKPGVTPNEIGRAIEHAITKRGFLPVRNLTGHGLGQYVVHDRPSIPNCPSGDRQPLSEGQVIAIEPFATTGEAGMIVNSTNPSIFSLKTVKPVRSPHARAVLQAIRAYNGLPFTTRWITRHLGRTALLGLIEPYPPLPEKTKGLVAQHEHTFRITTSGCERLTR